MTDEGEIEEYIELPDIIGAQEGDCLVRVEGAGYSRAGIREGDYLMVRPTGEPAAGALALAVRGGADSASSVVCDAEKVPSGAKFFGLVIGIIRKV